MVLVFVKEGDVVINDEVMSPRRTTRRLLIYLTLHKGQRCELT
jgi:hypothetical protein